jgi:RHS repeat-associated protein
VTDGTGAVKARHDYLPFGEELNAGIGGRTTAMGYDALDLTRQRFTSKERDIESGLDYFLARYYSSAQGRFTSADAPLVGQRKNDPQTWNLYQYARNNPLLYVDPTGEDYVLYQYDKDGNVIKTYQVTDIALLQQAGYEIYTHTADPGDGSILNVKGPDGTLYTAKYIPGNPGAAVEADSSFADAVLAELALSASGSNKLIAGFGVGTVIVGATGGAAAFYGGVALGGSAITTLGITEGGVAGGTAATGITVVSEATRQAFQRQLAQHGRAALEKSLQSFEKRLTEHLAKLEEYRKVGGYTSSVEREIRIFKESIQAIKEILGK